MRYLFHPAALRELNALPIEQTLLAFDFDGTLSHITDIPSEAVLTTETKSLLVILNKLASIAIISGRSTKDLKPRLGFSPTYVFGNHGIEGMKSHTIALPVLRKTCRTWKKTLETHLLFKTFAPGLFIEDKNYSLSIHYRDIPRKDLLRTPLLKLVGNLSPKPRIILGKCVLNLVPEGTPHKGTALIEAMRRARCSHALYIGDDDTDEDVFRLGDRLLFTIRVGKKTKSSAGYFLNRRQELNTLLQALIDLAQRECVA